MEPEYKVSEEQVKSLVEKSTKCEQSINIDCANTPLKTLSGENAWWTDYKGNLINNRRMFNVEIDDLAEKPYIPHKSLLQ